MLQSYWLDVRIYFQIKYDAPGNSFNSIFKYEQLFSDSNLIFMFFLWIILGVCRFFLTPDMNSA